MPTNNPYISLSKAENYTISKENRVRYSAAFSAYLKRYHPAINFAATLRDPEVDTFDELIEIMGKLELPVLFNIAMSRLIEFAPEALKSTGHIVNDTLNLVSCLEEELNAGSKFDNGPSPETNSGLNIPQNELKFDFFKEFRDRIFKLLERFLVQIIKDTILEVAVYLDGDRINRCTVPCDKNRNPYKNLYAKKAILKTGQNTLAFLQKKIQKDKLNTSPEILKEAFNKAFKELTPDELECLINGILSNDILNLLKDLLGDIVNDKEQIYNLFEDIDNIVEFTSGDGNMPTTPCGDLHIERSRRLQLEEEGKSPEEIETEIANTIQNHKERLNKIANILNNIPFDLNEILTIENSVLTRSILNKSINTAFDSLGKTYIKSMQEVLTTILVNPIGEACLAFYMSQIGNTDFGIESQIKDQIDQQIKPIDKIYLNNPLNFIFPTNFYNKYFQFLVGGTVQISFIYQDNKVFIDLNGKRKLTVIDDGIFVNFDQTQIFLPLTFDNDVKEFMNLHSRTEGLEALLKSNNHEVFGQINGSLIIDESILLSKTYNNLKTSIEKNIGKDFYFSEFNNKPEIKRQFVSLDYFQLENEKNKVKQEING